MYLTMLKRIKCLDFACRYGDEWGRKAVKKKVLSEWKLEPKMCL